MIYKQLISTCWLGFNKICCQPQGCNFSYAAAPSFGRLTEELRAGPKGNASQQRAEKRKTKVWIHCFNAAISLGF